jgi:1-deoxy-D-xylulose-5-phosphate reductoisomerase
MSNRAHDGPQALAVLGATGSIGVQTLEVAAREPGRLRVSALAAGRSLTALGEQCVRWRPRWVALEQAEDPQAARAALAAASPGAEVRVGPGSAAWLAAACGAPLVVNGIVGAAGLAASLAALERGARLALANKETLVVGGDLVARALAAHGGALLPVDSEHSAALQCLLGRPPDEVHRLTLTASGGPLLRHPDWRRATPEEVLRHPVWAMGARITTDSATLFNKGLEVLEARALFGLDLGRIEAVIHPQAVFHAMATFTDGSMVAQAARADMRLPIQLALSWPERWGPAVAPLPAVALAGLEFEPVEPARFPAFACVLAAGAAAGTAPCVVNAADEVAVAAFLAGRLALGALPGVLERVLAAHAVAPVESFAQLLEVDAWARSRAALEVGAA